MSNSDTPIFDQMNAWLKETKGFSYEEMLENMKPKKRAPRLRLSKGARIDGGASQLEHVKTNLPDNFVPVIRVEMEDLDKEPNDLANEQWRDFSGQLYDHMNGLFVPEEVDPTINDSIVKIGAVVAEYFQEARTQALPSLVETVNTYFKE